MCCEGKWSPNKGLLMLHCCFFSSFCLFYFEYFTPASKPPPIANVNAKDFQEIGLGFKGHVQSLQSFCSGPDHLKGGWWYHCLRGRLPRQLPASLQSCHTSSCMQNCLGNTLSTWLGPKAHVSQARGAKVAPYWLLWSVSENSMHNESWFQIHSTILSSNTYWAPTLFQALCSTLQGRQKWRETVSYHQGLGDRYERPQLQLKMIISTTLLCPKSLLTNGSTLWWAQESEGRVCEETSWGEICMCWVPTLLLSRGKGSTDVAWRGASVGSESLKIVPHNCKTKTAPILTYKLKRAAATKYMWLHWDLSGHPDSAGMTNV